MIGMELHAVTSSVRPTWTRYSPRGRWGDCSGKGSSAAPSKRAACPRRARGQGAAGGPTTSARPPGTVVHTAQEAARAVAGAGAAAPCSRRSARTSSTRATAAWWSSTSTTRATARTAYHRIVDLGAGRAPGVLVEEWVPHERELLVGMRRDEQFGPVVAFGLGGIFTEAVADVAFALPPLDDDDCARDGGRAARAAAARPRARAAARGHGPAARIIRAMARIAQDQPGDRRDRREPAARRRRRPGRRRRAGDPAAGRGAARRGRRRGRGDGTLPPAPRPRRGLRAALGGRHRRLGGRHQMGRLGAAQPHRRRASRARSTR